MRHALPFWPKLKSALQSTNAGSELVDKLSPIIFQLDQLVDELDSRYVQDNLVVENPETLTVPVVPAIIVLCLCRLVMMCNISGPKRVRASPKLITQGKEEAVGTEKSDVPPLLPDAEPSSAKVISP